MTQARRYGDRESHPIPLWNGIFDHYKKIGAALWEFAWCVDRVTIESDGIGWVLGKAPVRIEEIAATIAGSSEKTIRRHLASLASLGYIRRRRTPYGFVLGVVNSKKFHIWRAKENGQSDRSGGVENGTKWPISPDKVATLTGQSGRNKEDKAVDTAADAAVRPAVWDFLGVDSSRFSAQVREVCSTLYRSKNGETPAEFIGACMDGITALGARIPRDLAQRANALRSQAKPKAPDPVPELEAPPWVVE